MSAQHFLFEEVADLVTIVYTLTHIHFLDFSFLCMIFNTASSASSIVSEDARIEPRTVAITALTL